MSRPKAALVMWSGVEDLVLTRESRAELATLVDLVAPRAVKLSELGDDVAREIEILVGGWGGPVLDGVVLARLPKLRLLAYAAGTVKATVTPATWEHGVRVSTAAAANAIPVAELTFAAIVMIAKDVFRIRDRHREVHGREPVAGVGPAGVVGTRGLTVGVVGASRIGRLVIERLKSLEVDVAVADPYIDATAAASMGVACMELDNLFAWADVVTVHAPELPSTRHMVDAARLGRMHDGAWLINTARGSLVDTEALTAECVTGRLCAWIDTPDPEPLPADSPLYDLPNVVLTPHIAGSLGNEIAWMGEHAVAEVRRFVEGRRLEHEVRADDLERIA